MASGWWSSLLSWGRPAPQDPLTGALWPADPAPDDGSGPDRAPAAPTLEETAPPTGDPVHDDPPRSAPDPVDSDPLTTVTTTTGAPTVAQLDNVIADLLAIEGATGAAIVDIDSGMALATGGNPGFDLNVAAAGNSNVVRAKLRTITDLELKDEIEDVLITLQGQYHLINVLRGQGNAGLFIYLVLNRTTANLALARHKLRSVAAGVAV
ncbi:hypothetical protein GCM10028783_29610 [Modestobacter muralis]